MKPLAPKGWGHPIILLSSDKWRYSFIAFYEDMGSKPFPKAQIDREENNGNYEPDNCRWVTPTVNANNKRNSRKNKELTNGN